MGDKDFRFSLIVPSIQEQSFSIEGSNFADCWLSFAVSLKKNAWRKTVIFWGGVFFFSESSDSRFLGHFCLSTTPEGLDFHGLRLTTLFAAVRRLKEANEKISRHFGVGRGRGWERGG